MGTCTSDLFPAAAPGPKRSSPDEPSYRPKSTAASDAANTARVGGGGAAGSGAPGAQQGSSGPQAEPTLTKVKGQQAWAPPTARQRLRAGVLRWMATRRAILNGDTFQAEAVEDTGDSGSRLQVCHGTTSF
jgi:hypothetical protein